MDWPKLEFFLLTLEFWYFFQFPHGKLSFLFISRADMTLTFDASPNSSQYSFYPSRILLPEIVLPFGMPPVYIFNIYNSIELVDHGPETK